jgi:hypothetical protein
MCAAPGFAFTKLSDIAGYFLRDRLGNSFDRERETGENPSPDIAIQAKRAGE